MATLTLLLGLAFTLMNLLAGLWHGWKEWHAPPAQPHPLEAGLRDITQAIRDIGLHL
jgi:hypothetical protein